MDKDPSYDGGGTLRLRSVNFFFFPQERVEYEGLPRPVRTRLARLFQADAARKRLLLNFCFHPVRFPLGA